jgi:poly(A) polymerase
MRTNEDIAGAATAAQLQTVLAEAFAARGQELYLVGGAVRDALLGKTDIDLDFATSARPGTTMSVIDELHIGKPYRVGEKFGTIGVRLPDRVLEITTYRSAERYEAGSRKPTVQFGDSLMEDLRRRDFTINAIAQNARTGEIIDPLGGRPDLERGLIRAVGDPAERFREDPLRLLRGVRFATRLGFEIERATRDAMLTEAPSLRFISRERVRDEYTAMLLGPEPARSLTLLRELTLLDYSVPELLGLASMPDHGPFHPLSLWDHTMRVVAEVPPQLPVRWAAVLHDIAKPATRTHEPSGRPRFFHHEEVGAEIARRVLASLRYSNGEIDQVALLVETHMQLHSYSPEWSDGAVRRLVLRLGALIEPAIALARADAAGHSLTGDSASSGKYLELERRIEMLGRQPAPPQSPVSGDDLIRRYGRPPGPWIRPIKEAICDAILDGELDEGDVEGAWRIADAVVRSEL